jgi:mono/diheme cytochrome c family protein
MKTFLGALLFTLLVTVSGTAMQENGTRNQSDATAAADAEHLPAGDGRELIAVACTTCHDLTNVKSQKLSKDEWKIMVERMVGYGTLFDGARLDEEQIALAVNYLSTHYTK